MKNLLLIILFFTTQLASSQSQGLKWVKKIGGAFYDKGNAIAIDPSGNIYTIGSFQGTVDFDPGPGTFNLTTGHEDLRAPLGYGGIFISKLDAFGNFVWAKKLGDSSYYYGFTEYAIALDKSGNIYTTGTFRGTNDFDPGIGVYNLTSDGLPNIFVSKLDTAGNFVWAKKIGGRGHDDRNSIAVDVYGNLYTTGYFEKTVDFDPGAGTFNLTAFEADLFILKLDASGNFVWAKNIGGFDLDNRGTVLGNSIALDSSGDLYCLGSFTGLTDFDPDTAQNSNLTSNGEWDIFLLKMKSSGDFVWAKKIGGYTNDWGKSICIDALGYICVAGEFGRTVDFDPGVGIFNLTAEAENAVFISKLNSSGNFVWAKKLDGNHWEKVHSITGDASGNVYSIGQFNKTVDFDPGTGIFNLTATGGDIYISKLNVRGEFVWAKRIGSGDQNDGNSILLDGFGNIYTTGYFTGTADFGMGSGIFNITSDGSADAFICKIRQDSCTSMALVIDSLRNISCDVSIAYVSTHAIYGRPPYGYIWNTTIPLKDSIASFTSAGTYTLTVKDANGCLRSTSVLISSPPAVAGYDMNAGLFAEGFRPGRPTVLKVDGFNDGCTPVNGQLCVILNKHVKLNKAFPVPDLITGDTLTWNFINLNYDSKPIKPIINITTYETTVIGDSICFVVFITPVKGDANISNNRKRYCYPVVNSYDPNIKSVYPEGACEQRYVLKNKLLTYTVQFQNTGTADAIDIYILDTLDIGLDIKSIRVTGQSHQRLTTELLPGRVLKFDFKNINLPDSSRDEPGSHGYVIYELMPDSNVVNGTKIEGKAGIYFDFNPVVFTNEVHNTLQNIIPMCSAGLIDYPEKLKFLLIYPNPTSGQLNIEIQKAGDAMIYDVLGNLVYKNSCTTGKNTFDISTLSSGIYVLKVNGCSMRVVKID